MYSIYGINNCNSVKKTLTHFNDHGIAYHYHDYKKDGLTKTKLLSWCKQLRYEELINKKGTTWRKLGDATKENMADQSSAIETILQHTSLIKRPLIEKDNKIILLGYDANAISKLIL